MLILEVMQLHNLFLSKTSFETFLICGVNDTALYRRGQRHDLPQMSLSPLLIWTWVHFVTGVL